MSQATLVWDDFSGGDYGTLGMFDAKANQVSALNMILRKDGSLCPRPGVRKHTVTGAPSGEIRGLFYIGQADKLVMVVIDDTVYECDTDSDWAMTALTPALTAAADQDVFIAFYDPNGIVYLTNPGDRTYAVDWTAGTLSDFQVAGDDRGFRAIALVRDRLYLSGQGPDTEDGWRVYYSEPADFDNFPALNYFDVGYYWTVWGFVTLGNAILMPKRNDGWWALVGQTPAGTLRQVETDRGTHFDAASKQLSLVRENGRLWFFGPGDRLRVTDGSRFDVNAFAHIVLDDPQYGVYLDSCEHTVYVSARGNRGLIKSWGAWFHQEYGVSVDGHVTTSEFHTRAILGGTEPDGGGVCSYYSLDLDLDRPAFTTDDHARPGDNSTTPLPAEVWFRPEVHKEGRMWRPSKIIVEFTKWNTGATNNSFTPTVRVMGRDNTAAGSQDTYQEQALTAWTEATSQATTTGERDRYEVSCPALDYGSVIQVGLESVAGVAIHRVICYLDIAGAPGPGRPIR